MSLLKLSKSELPASSPLARGERANFGAECDLSLGSSRTREGRQPTAHRAENEEICRLTTPMRDSAAD